MALGWVVFDEPRFVRREGSEPEFRTHLDSISGVLDLTINHDAEEKMATVRFAPDLGDIYLMVEYKRREPRGPYVGENVVEFKDRAGAITAAWNYMAK